MLDRDDVRELIAEEGLGEAADVIMAPVRAGYRLAVLDAANTAAPGMDRIGGDPDLTHGERWPVSHEDWPMVFLAQINCSGLPPLPAQWPDPTPWPHHGALIRIFANLLADPGAPCAARALLADPSAELIRRPTPARSEKEVPEDAKPVESPSRLPECAVRPIPFLTLPEVLPGIVESWWGSSPPAERYRRLSQRLRDHETPLPEPARLSPVHHFLGEPRSIQDDVKQMAAFLVEDPHSARQREIAPEPALGEPDAWRCLLALHDDERIGLHIGDAGGLHVMVPVADLTANRLDRLMCDESSC